jgi:hypothetical protein
MELAPYIVASDPYYTLAATFLAFLPFIITLFSQTPVDEQDRAKDEKNVLGPILTYLISDLEMSILQVLDQQEREMSTRDILNQLKDELDVDRSDLNRCLYRMHAQFIICMRKDKNKPMWSISA